MPPPVAPADAAAADLARATELVSRAEDLKRRGKYVEATDAAREALRLREAALGSEHLEVARCLHLVSTLLGYQYQHAEARTLQERALELRERHLGAEHPEVGASLSALAEIRASEGEAGAALGLHERALAIFEKALGPDHVNVGRALIRLADAYVALGRLTEALPLSERSVSVLERALGPQHRSVAVALGQLATALRRLGKLPEARARFEQALVILEKDLGVEHPQVAILRGNLAGVLQEQGELALARRTYEQSLTVLERALGPDNLEVATILHNLATVLGNQAEYAEARRLHERAVAIAERRLGSQHPRLAPGLANLAHLMHLQGDSVAARPLLERAIAIGERAYGPDHPDVAHALGNLAGLLLDEGAYGEARARFVRARSILEKALGRDHVRVAIAVSNEADLLMRQGSFLEARPLYARALAIQERALGSEHENVAIARSNLAAALRAQGLLDEAQPLLEQAVAGSERALGPDHPNLATAVHNLGLVYFERGALAPARRSFERALAIWERALGPEHPAVAGTLHSLAIVLGALGEHAPARAAIARALAIRERTLGPDHPDLGSTLAAQATVLASQGSRSEAQAALERALALTEGRLVRQLVPLSPRQRLALARRARLLLDQWLVFTTEAGIPGYDPVLRFKGVVGRVEARARARQRASVGEPAAQLESLRQVERRLARLGNEVPLARSGEATARWQKAYAQAAAERELLLRALDEAALRPSAAAPGVQPTLDEVRGRLRADEALVDVLLVRGRYLAWIVRLDAEPVTLDLGAAEDVDQACWNWLTALRGNDTADEPAGQALKALVWSPLAARLGPRVRRVVVCPDATLAAVPLGALPGRSPGTSLLDDVDVSYVMNAGDLVPTTAPRAPAAGALAVGGVDYDRAAAPQHETASQPRVEPAPANGAPRSGRFTPLDATTLEAQLVGRLAAPQATVVLLGAQATEANVRASAGGRRLVHVATHGFARDDQRAGLRSRRVQEDWTNPDLERQLAVGHDPLVLCGLALAGANSGTGSGGDDGILTALEASYLDLEGCELATLSACETARGTAESGEGVLGLVSAFRMAGARNVIASLWKVDDEATQLLMEGLYARLLRAQNPLAPVAALREAALALRDRVEPDGRRRFAAPRYWAAFIAYGR